MRATSLLMSASWYSTKFNPSLSHPVRLFLFRHGESQANLSPAVISGQSNFVELTENGIEQAKQLGEFINKENIYLDLYYSSTAKRTIQTANLSMENCSWFNPEKLVKSKELLEIDMGDWVGKNRTDVYTKEVLHHIDNDPWNFKPENGESQKEVEERVCSYISNEILTKADSIVNKQEINIGIFGHCLAIACFIRSVLSSNPEMTWKIKHNNTAYTELYFTPEKGWFVEKINRIPS